MGLHGLVHRLVLTVGLASLVAAPAIAQRCATSTTEDAAVRGVRTALSAPATQAPRPGLAAPAKPAPATPTAPTRDDRKRMVPVPAVKALRTVPRVKAPSSHAPASPGMGTLLKWTTGAGRDMSFLFGDTAKADDADHILAGRAPPRAGPHSNLLRPALTPVAPTLWARAVQGPDPCGPDSHLTFDAEPSHFPWQLQHAPRLNGPWASESQGSRT